MWLDYNTETPWYIPRRYEKGKLVVRRGRKITGLLWEVAGPPNSIRLYLVDFAEES
jgi:hypothetical protein